jgi:hypothetical protein
LLNKNCKDAALERYKVIGIFSKNNRWFILSSETMKSYCRLKSSAKYRKFIKEVVINGIASLFKTGKKELSVLKKKHLPLL